MERETDFSPSKEFGPRLDFKQQLEVVWQRWKDTQPEAFEVDAKSQEVLMSKLGEREDAVGEGSA